MTLGEAAEQLYRLPPAQFVARRADLVAAARAAGDRVTAREIGQLQRPTLAAWAVNQVSWQRPDDMAQLRDVAQLLREAQEALDAAELRRLSRRRAEVVERVLGTAIELAGEVSLAAEALRQVESTLVAALSDEAAADAVASGRLTRALSYAGFGDVDLSGAVVPVPARDPGPQDAPPSRRTGAGARAQGEADGDPSPSGDPGPADLERDRAARVTAAERALDDAEASARAATARLGVARAQRELADARVAALEAELEQARRARGDVAAAEATATAAARAAQAQVATQAAELDRARAGDAPERS